MCFIRLQLSLPNHGRIGWNVALSDDSAQVSDPPCRWLINNDMHKLTVPLQSLSNHWFLCRVNSVIGIGVGAGAYILSRFAVSPHPDESIYISTHLLFTICLIPPQSPFFVLLSVTPVTIEAFQATQCVTLLSIKASHQAHTGHQVSPQSAAYAAIPHMMNHLGDSLLFQFLSSCFHIQRSGAKISAMCVQQSRKS